MELVVRAVLIFAFLWLVTRLVGRSTIGELSAFQLVLFVAMGDLAQQGVTQQDSSLTGVALTIGTFAVLTMALAWAGVRFPRVRGITHGIPVIIVRNGEVELKRLRSERLSLDDLMLAARQQGIRRFDEIELAVLESNGRISFFTQNQGEAPQPES